MYFESRQLGIVPPKAVSYIPNSRFDIRFLRHCPSNTRELNPFYVMHSSRATDDAVDDTPERESDPSNAEVLPWGFLCPRSLKPITPVHRPLLRKHQMITHLDGS